MLSAHLMLQMYVVILIVPIFFFCCLCLTCRFLRPWKVSWPNNLSLLAAQAAPMFMDLLMLSIEKEWIRRSVSSLWLTVGVFVMDFF